MVAKILVAEHDGRSLVEMLHLLKGRGYLTAFATDGDEAIRLARMELPDLILCNWALSCVHGGHAVRYLQNDRLLRKIPVIVLFDAYPTVVGGRFTPPGVMAHIANPIDPKSFIGTIERYVMARKRPSRMSVPLRGHRRKDDSPTS